MDRKSIKDTKSGEILKPTYIAVVCVIVVWALTFFLFFISESDKRGQFGDMFGAVNALFSGLAFAGLIITLLLQKAELGLQRDELEQTREELKNQRLEFETQNETLKRQQFESVLYNMLQLQQQIVNDLSYDTAIEGYNDTTARSNWSVVVKGRDVFRFAFEQLKHHYLAFDGTSRTSEGMKEILQNLGLSYYRDFITPSYFDHYFRHLYRILKYIVRNNDLTFKEKYKYIGDVRGTLSRYELVWIYYNLLSNCRFKQFKTIAEDYSLLKNLSEDFLALSKENVAIVKQKGHDYFSNEGFSGTDYEFFITDAKGDASKFYVGAFYNKEELDEGLEIVKKYRRVIEECAYTEGSY